MKALGSLVLFIAIALVIVTITMVVINMDDIRIALYPKPKTLNPKP